MMAVNVVRFEYKDWIQWGVTAAASSTRWISQFATMPKTGGAYGGDAS